MSAKSAGGRRATDDRGLSGDAAAKRRAGDGGGRGLLPVLAAVCGELEPEPAVWSAVDVFGGDGCAVCDDDEGGM